MVSNAGRATLKTHNIPGEELADLAAVKHSLRAELGYGQVHILSWSALNPCEGEMGGEPIFKRC